jgi:hypothetical protein
MVVGAARRPRAAAVAAGAAVAVTAAGLASWSAFGPRPQATAQASALRQQQVPAPTISCEIRYQTKKDEGGAFAVDLAVVNSGERPAQTWTLRFDFPADQRLTGGTGAAWSQSGHTVTARGSGPLAPGATAAVSMTGGYQASNPIPTAFALNDAACRATITGATAVPVSITGNNQAPAPAPVSGSGAGSGTPNGQDVQRLRDKFLKGDKGDKGGHGDNGGHGD